ncbi:methyltransferase-like protein 23 isoform X2 [Clupea harengus]|uniref:Methyltransferase-like protein 23 isoform X2 n=1 Tax=Clupea harengus TaxID=7950 RepID=A0A8M1KA34_CLUHA|nr:methyltransferase-like protein 23 isoform X2 [Clupea harengus]
MIRVLDPQYGMYVWPCAVVLAQYVWTQRGEIKHKTILELGAGVSLPGAVAAKCGATVILSDSAELPRCLDNCRRTCEANSLREVGVVGLTWGQVSPELIALPPLHVILGSDVFYEPDDFEGVLVTVTFLLRRSPGVQFWTTYQERSADWSIEALLHKWRLSCRLVPLDSFGAQSSQIGRSTLPGSHVVQMMVITAQEPEQEAPL